MKTTTRSLILAVSLVLLLVSPAFATDVGGRVDIGQFTVYGADEAAVERIREIESVFDAAGFQLPAMTIHVYPNNLGCDGLSGRFNNDGSGTMVELCSMHRFWLLHEFAHAWTYNNLSDDDRIEFMDYHGLEAWNSKAIDWADRGMEVAAETIAKGLLDSDLPEWQLDEAPALAAGYQILTGMKSPRFEAALAFLDQ